ncbi:MAG: phytanoyl-CoA dioxygenase family protein [Acidimicrobiales bacterium]|nr:phytanoyl-CoA dioxygenase family protein [Acidimicrobiales bacterium]
MIASHPKVTEELHAAYSADGVVKISNAVSEEWLPQIEAMADAQLLDPGRWVTDTNPGATRDRLFTSRYRWKSDPMVNHYIYESGVGHIAAALMGSASARFYFDHLLIKEPKTQAPTPWHQDIPYWPFLGKQICSAWVSTSRVTVEESSLEFVRGSHSWNSYFAPEAFDGSKGWVNDFEGEPCPDVAAAREDYDIVGFDVEPGDALFFSAWALHGSPGNAGNGRRVALSTRWLGDDATWYPHPGCDPTVTGEDTTVEIGQYPGDEDLFPLVYQTPDASLREFNS